MSELKRPDSQTLWICTSCNESRAGKRFSLNGMLAALSNLKLELLGEFDCRLTDALAAVAKLRKQGAGKLRTVVAN